MIAVFFVLAVAQMAGISGAVPAHSGEVQPPGHVTWLAATPSESDEVRPCLLTSTAGWSCPTVPIGERGVVVIQSEDAVSCVVIGPAGIAPGGSAPWGRLVRVASAGLAEPVDLRLSIWVVDRPAIRPNTLRLDVIPDNSASVLKVSDTAF